MPLEKPVSDAYPAIHPAVQLPAETVNCPPAHAVIRGARFISPSGPRAEMEQLADRIAELSARIQAATYELLVLIHQFDQREGWSDFSSCAHWLSWRAGLAPGAAREHVRVARALADLPRLSDAMRRGVISYSKVRAVTRVATPETEQTLLDVALAGTAAHVEQVVRAWRRVDRTAEAADDRRRHASRVLHTWVDDDGMVVIRGRLTPEVGAVVRRALEAALDEERRAAAAARSAVEPDPVDEAVGVAPSFGQRQADAWGMVAECALAGGLDRGSAGDRYQVVLHVDAGTLAEDADVPAGTSPPAQRHHPSHGAPIALSGAAAARARHPALAAPRSGSTGRSGWHPCFSRNRPAVGLRRRHRRDAAWFGRAGARRRPQDPHDLPCPAQGAGVSRPAVPIPRMPGPPLRCASHTALGAWRGDGARQSGAALPAASPGSSRGGIQGHRRPERSSGVRAARRAPTARSTVDTELDRLAAGADVEAVGGSRHRHRRDHRHAGVARRAAGPELGDRNPVAAAPRHGHGARRSRGNVRPVTAAWNQ